MKGNGRARSHGAVSILNAFSTGKGGAMGVDLFTTAHVTLREGGGQVSGFIDSHPDESVKLVVTAVEKTLDHYGYRSKLSGEVVTSSNIPPAVGLKSSSAAVNATTVATMSALDKEIDDDLAISLGIDASLEAGVSLTGGFDDSFASYYGGAVLTDNELRKVTKQIKISDGLRILIFVPQRKTYTGNTDRARFSSIRQLADLAYKEALDGHVWEALTLNGLACGSVLGEDPKPVLTALDAGALGAGLSGKGPAVVAVVEEENVKRAQRAWKGLPGQVILSSPNLDKSGIEE